MAEQSTFMQFTYPSEGENPFYDSYLAQVEQLDQALFMNKIQNNLFVGGGGTLTFTPSTGVLNWSDDFIIPIFHFGKKLNVPYGPFGTSRTATLLDGYAIVVNIPYTMSDNVTASMQILSQLTPLNHQQWVMGWRSGNKVYFKGMNPVG